jgi:hypothetical protein
MSFQTVGNDFGVSFVNVMLDSSFSVLAEVLPHEPFRQWLSEAAIRCLCPASPHPYYRYKLEKPGRFSPLFFFFFPKQGPYH